MRKIVKDQDIPWLLQIAFSVNWKDKKRGSKSIQIILMVKTMRLWFYSVPLKLVC